MSIVTFVQDIIRRVGRFEANVAACESTGFVNQTDSTLSYVAGTRTLTVTPAVTSFDVYFSNRRKTYTSAQSVAHADTEGMHYFYFDGADRTLKSTMTFANSLITGCNALVAFLYWDATNKAAVLDIFDERHGMQMDGQTHFQIHLDIGAVWRSGLALSNITAGENGNTNSHAQFGVGSGQIADEDISFSISEVVSTTGLPILYLDGATPVLREATEAGYSVLTDTTAGVGVTGRLTYNLDTAGTWSVETVDNNDFVLCHVFAIGSNTDAKRMYAVLGQAQYATLKAARDGALTELTSIISALPFAEIKPIATVIFQTGDTYGNDVKAKIVSTDDGDDYIDWRTSAYSQAGGTAVSDHNNLSGIQGGAVNEYYHLTAAEYAAIHSTANFVLTTSGGFVRTTSDTFVTKAS